MKTQQENKEVRKLRFLLAAPVITLPFLTLMFWAMGGGQTARASVAGTIKKGLNNILPDANLKQDTDLDKMAYYDKALKDSTAKADQLRSDPYFRGQASGPTSVTLPVSPYDPGNAQNLNTTPVGQGYADPNEAKVYQKLGQIKSALNQDSSPAFPAPNNGSPSGPEPIGSQDIARLEKMLSAAGGKTDAQDPEMDQLSGMLEKIMDIQNPERQQEKLRQLSAQRKGQVYAVTIRKKLERNSLLDAEDDRRITEKANVRQQEGNGFYSLEGQSADTDEQNAVDAVIAETQTISSGSVIKIKLLNDIYINGRLIPKEHFVFGTASLNGERLEIEIPSIRYKKSLFPVSLSVVDIDGLEGIYIPGAIARDVAKESTDRAIQDLSFGTGMSTSVGIQAAGAGVEAAKTLFSKKIKLIKVTVKAGYKILLRDEKQKLNN